MYGGFCLQNELMKYIDPFLMNIWVVFTPFLSIIVCTLFRKQDIEIITLLVMFLFLLPGKLMILIGMKQFEDRYQGGEIGFTQEVRDKMRIEHFRELELIGLDSISNI